MMRTAKPGMYRLPAAADPAAYPIGVFTPATGMKRP